MVAVRIVRMMRVVAVRIVWMMRVVRVVAVRVVRVRVVRVRVVPVPLHPAPDAPHLLYDHLEAVAFAPRAYFRIPYVVIQRSKLPHQVTVVLPQQHLLLLLLRVLCMFIAGRHLRLILGLQTLFFLRDSPSPPPPA